MKINRFNADFGNSMNNFLLDSYYFDMPTNIVEISEARASNFFVDSISDSKDLRDRMLVSTEIDGEPRFYLVGNIAEDSALSNTHVGSMHDKINSIIPYVSFLAASAYYHALNTEKDSLEDTIEIECIRMMLPIWLLKKEEKFSIAHKKMADRFIGEHYVSVITPGMKRDLKINAKNAKCYNEGEIARLALKYKLQKQKDEATSKETVEMVKREESAKFDDFETVLTDIGGGSTDAVLLALGLALPKSRDSFQIIDILPFLGALENLRKEKLLEHFTDLRTLEVFIIKNYKNHTYVLENQNTGESTDVTQIIKEFLQDYASVLVSKLLDAFISTSSRTLKFIYFGGEAPILEEFILNALRKHISKEAIQNNHFFLHNLLEQDPQEVFPPTARTINLNALELRSFVEAA